MKSSTFCTAFASQRRVDFFGFPLSSFSPVSNSSRMNPFMSPRTEEPVFGSSTRLMFHDHVVRRELPPVVPLDGLPQPECPRLQVRARLPLFAEAGPGDVVRTGHGQVVAHLPDRVRALDPAEAVRVLHVLTAHADAERAALGRRALRPRLADEPLARDRADGRVGRRRRQAEERRVAKEFAAVDLTLGELALEGGDGGMLAGVCHRRILPGRGRSEYGDGGQARSFHLSPAWRCCQGHGHRDRSGAGGRSPAYFRRPRRRASARATIRRWEDRRP